MLGGIWLGASSLIHIPLSDEHPELRHPSSTESLSSVVSTEPMAPLVASDATLISWVIVLATSTLPRPRLAILLVLTGTRTVGEGDDSRGAQASVRFGSR